MEKDKLMELLEELTNERKGIENAIEKQRDDKTEKGLNLIFECLKYIKEMAKYFKQIDYDTCALSNYTCNSQFCLKNGHSAISVGGGIVGYYTIYLTDFEHYTIEELITKKDTRYSCLNSSARLLADSDFTLAKLQKIVNELLAKIIVSYKEKNDKLKEQLQ